MMTTTAFSLLASLALVWVVMTSSNRNGPMSFTSPDASGASVDNIELIPVVPTDPQRPDAATPAAESFAARVADDTQRQWRGLPPRDTTATASVTAAVDGRAVDSDPRRRRLLTVGEFGVQMPKMEFDHSDPLQYFTKKAGWAIAGFNDENLLDVTAEQCAMECMSRVWCASFDFHAKRASCSLASVVSTDVGREFKPVDGFTFYERDGDEHMALLYKLGYATRPSQTADNVGDADGDSDGHATGQGHSHNLLRNHDTINYVPNPPKKYKLVVGVLSARHHFARRELIRKTFFKYAEQYPDVLFRFVVGDKHCALAPQHRQTSWDCVPKKDIGGDGKRVPHAPRYIAKERLVDELLHEEAERFKDILLVDHVDVYRTLAAKLAKYYQWISQHLLFDFSLKVDDDTWVHVPNIMKDIDKVSTSGTWWSHFRTDWKVHGPGAGKWSEHDYTSKNYPSFGCGGGNIVTSDLASFVGGAVDDLLYYQGEDVSMGIWLAGVKMTRKENANFHVAKCRATEFTQPQMEPQKFLEYYANYEKCKNICNCT
eukprot:TRINITY_DN59674_c0_g2_i2.p1 TRINITY_DN59674_c0_g2~~TRINITY_DN59674_c0_g2_i2.p1  ORF type:complete len:543 (+),score=220.19 TRINITY_DN59674_c0_g2_i2:20-1648(+)